MNTPRNSRTSVLIIILLGLLIVAYKVFFAPAPLDLIQEDENTMTIQRVEGILSKIDTIDFDNASMANDPKFQSLRSLEIPPLNLPHGKQNPFSVIFGKK